MQQTVSRAHPVAEEISSVKPSVQEKFRVLVLESTLMYGGMETLLFNVFTRLNPALFEVTFCTLYDQGTMGLRFTQQGYRLEHSLILRKYDPRAFLRLGQLIRRNHLDLIYLVTQPLTLFWGVLVGKAYRLPLACLIGNNLKIEEHPKLRLYRLLLPFVDAIIAQAELQRQHLVNDQHLPARLMRVIHNGIDCAPFRKGVDRAAKLESLGLPSNARIVGLNGRQVKLKGVDVLLRAAQQLVREDPALHFIIVGTGPDLEGFKGLAEELHIEDRVHFLGFREDLAELVQLYDVAVLASRTEAFPIALLEYMAAGRAIVATSVGSVPEVLQDGATGLLVEPEAPAGLAGAIRRFLRDPGLGRRCALAALAAVQERFSIERICRETESLIANLILKRRGDSCRER
jgi:glycosyltransferase involved in cell wall biosynthesis